MGDFFFLLASIKTLTTAQGKDLVNAYKIGFHAFIKHLLNVWKLVVAHVFLLL